MRRGLHGIVKEVLRQNRHSSKSSGVGPILKALGVAALATIGLVGFAQAADVLPATKPAPSQPENCFASVWSFLDSTAADCPFTYRGFILYAALDAGLMYNTDGAPWNPAYVNGTHGLISKQSNGPKWLWSPNNINQSVIGIKMSEPIADGWSLVGTLEAGFDPLSGYLADSQRAQVMNNGKPLALESVNGDSSRAGQWDNSQFFLGFSNKTYGTLTGGRVNALSLDGLIAYDPMGAAYAFSPFGFTGMYPGFADTELARSNTAIKYRGEFGNFRVAGLAQIGGYNQGNGSSQMWQGQVGRDIHNLYGGTLSLDVVGGHAVDGVLTSLFTTPIPKFYSTNDLKATLSNNTGFLALSKYTWGPAQLFAGWEYFRQGNPSNDYPNGFKTIGGYSVPGNIIDNKAFPTVWITTNAFNIQRVYNTIWAGFKYAVNARLDVMGAFYYAWQNNFSTTPCTGQGIHTSSSSCAGTLDTLSLLIDYRPVKRIDVYAGVALSNVYAGLANGFQQTQNINPTVGVRIKF
jgi:predicted porin